MLRLLLTGLGLILGIVGFMQVTMAWMRGLDPTPLEWLVLIAGIILWVQGLPVMRASDREDRRRRLRAYLRGDKI